MERCTAHAGDRLLLLLLLLLLILLLQIFELSLCRKSAIG
jgi:hypothetical protein